MLALIEGLLDRDRAVTLVRVLPALEERWTLRAEEDLATCRLLWLLARDLLLLLDAFFAKMGSTNSIRTKTSVTKAILTLFRYFIVDIIRLLSLTAIAGRQVKLPAFDLAVSNKILHSTEFHIC